MFTNLIILYDNAYLKQIKKKTHKKNEINNTFLFSDE